MMNIGNTHICKGKLFLLFTLSYNLSITHTLYSLAICFAPSLADSIIFLTLTRLVVVINFVNFSFALFTPPLSDFQTGIMKLIFNQPRGKWPEELIKVVWSHNTTVSRSTGFTTFKLLFGDEAITPEEAKAGSIRTVASAEDEADYSVAKDAIEGTRLQAVENINKYQVETIK
jgi:hypothetical protein